MDIMQLLHQLSGKQPDTETLAKMQALANSQSFETVSAEPLAQAVQQGDLTQIQAAVGQFLSTPEGAKFAEQLRKTLGK